MLLADDITVRGTELRPLTAEHFGAFLQDNHLYLGERRKLRSGPCFVKLPDRLYIKEAGEGKDAAQFIQIISQVYYLHDADCASTDKGSEMVEQVSESVMCRDDVVMDDHSFRSEKEIDGCEAEIIGAEITFVGPEDSVTAAIANHTADVATVCGFPDQEEDEKTEEAALVYDEESNTNSQSDQIKTKKVKIGYALKHECNICDLQFKRLLDVRDHFRKEHKGIKPFKCPICARGFTEPKRVQTHIRIHTGRGLRSCGDCGKSFISARELKQHTENFKGKDCSKYRVHSCEFCTASFTRLATLTRHYSDAHKVDKSHKCEECGRMFKHRHDLTKHVRMHTGDKVHVCTFCGNFYLRERELLSHVSSKHTGKRPHKCDLCDKSFAVDVALATHKRNLHSARDYMCETCGVAFSTPSRLKMHNFSHGNDTPYKCDVCFRIFTRIYSLRTHMKIHSGQKPYCCETCGKTFLHFNKLRAHKHIHTDSKPYVCVTCGKAYMSSNSLKIHHQVHTGVKPHICQVCQHSFVQKQGLKKHMQRKHGQVRVFPCKVCSENFDTHANLKAHIDTMHLPGHVSSL